MKLRKLNKDEHVRTRKLWEEVFTMDTKEFLDYYYSVKVQGNEMFVMEEEDKIIATLHLNPYDMRINENIHRTNYIVAVATDAKYRKQGIMGRLLKQAMRTMYDRKEPFAFLMPAAEAIYYPYDFRYIYSRNQGDVCGKNLNIDIEIVMARPDDCEKIAEFANELLKQYQVVAYRDVKYYQTLIAEQESEAGGVVMIQKQGELAGVFFYAKGESYEIREPLYIEESDFSQAVYSLTKDENEVVKCFGYGKEKKPIIMARILHLETFLRCLKLEQDVDIYLALEDHFIEENNGVFHIVGTVENGITLVEKQDDFPENVKKIQMGDFTVEVFQRFLPKVFLNEVV